VTRFTVNTINLQWQEATLPYADRLRTILESWKDTPYMVCQQEKGVGVDCVRFVAAVWDEMRATPGEQIPRLSRDASLNNPRKTTEFMRMLLDRYAPIEELTNKQYVVEPGDVLVVRAKGGGPGHVILVGPDRNTTWQAGSRKVIRSGWTLLDRFQILSHWFRYGDRSKWLTQQPSQSS